MAGYSTIDAVARHYAATASCRHALRFEGEVLSFEDLFRRASQVAGALHAAGLGPGDRIAVLAKNHPALIELWLGACMRGATLVPINWRLTGQEVAFILVDCGARILFLDSSTTALVTRDITATLQVVGIAGAGGWHDYEEWRDAAAPLASTVSTPEAIAVQLYTSGTTGQPKGALLSHRALLGLGDRAQQLEWFRWAEDDVGLIAMPLFHVGGLAWFLRGFEAGAPGLLLREFDTAIILDHIDRGEFTKVFLVPAALQMLVRHPRAEHTDFTALRLVLYGASPMPIPLLRECMERIGCAFAQQYGMTETCGTIVALPPADHRDPASPRLAAAGLALPGVELRVRDENGQALPPGKTGEIETRSSANMSGYWGNTAATAKAVDADGWLRTGDLGMIDADGYLHIHDRISDMIISGGENVYPAEVESHLSNHPAIAEAAVIGIPDPVWGETVAAVIVVRRTSQPKDTTADMLTAHSLNQWCRARIAAYKAPRHVFFVETLPRNASGKILRRELREKFAAKPNSTSST